MEILFRTLRSLECTLHITPSGRGRELPCQKVGDALLRRPIWAWLGLYLTVIMIMVMLMINKQYLASIWCENVLGYLSTDMIFSKKQTVFQERSPRKNMSYKEQIMSKDKYPSIL